MPGKQIRKDDGQSLIQFALMIVMLLAFVSLAVDAGNVFSVRRKLQNAADAAALAAARELCLGHSAGQARTTASTYLVKNGASGISETTGGGSSTIAFSNDNTRVVVKARGTAGMLLGSLVSADTIQVVADANAACGSAKSACNLWPIVFNATLWEQIPCGKTIAVWDTDNTHQVECVIGGKYEPNLCKCYNCDPQNLLMDDFLVVSDVQRGWVDFPVSEDPRYPDVCKENGSGASELNCNLENGFQGRITLPKWIDALNGVKASGFKEVEDRSGDTVRIPLYGDLKVNKQSSGHDPKVDQFNVSKFGCVQVDGVEKNKWLNPLPGMPKSYKPIKMTAVYVTKSCNVCTTACGSTDGTPAEPWELRAANIVD
jgi:hypothetical protein